MSVSQSHILVREEASSTFMLYLWVDKKIDSDFHTVYFSDDYKSYVDWIFDEKTISDDISFYLRNWSVLDDSLAPEWK